MHGRQCLSQHAGAVASEISIPRGSRVRKPYWGYEDIGILFVFLVLLTPVFRLLVYFHLLLRSELSNPSIGLQFALVAFLGLTLYLVLKLRHRQPVLRPLGWVLPGPAYTVAALLLGISFASGVALFYDIFMLAVGLDEKRLPLHQPRGSEAAVATRPQ